jgi:hypothetical protein
LQSLLRGCSECACYTGETTHRKAALGLTDRQQGLVASPRKKFYGSVASLRRAPGRPLLPPPDLSSIWDPLAVLERILLCLDIRSLQSLTCTSVTFDQLINSRHILDLNLHFCQDFLAELSAAASIDKILEEATAEDHVREA